MCVHRIDVVWSKWELEPLHITEWVYNSMADIEMSNKKAKADNMTIAVIGITKKNSYDYCQLLSQYLSNI
jgi:hypothetical protein